jgi:hypothetical protein
MTFISDLVLAPAGLSLQMARMTAPPLQGAALELSSVGLMLLSLAAFWLVGQLLVAFFLRWVASSWLCRECWSGVRGFLALFLQLSVFSVVIGIAIVLLQVPLGLAVTLLMLSSNGALGLLALVVGGVALWLTLWFLMAIFFVNEAILLERQSFWKALLRSAALVHQNFGSTLTLAALINLLMYGFRAVWDMLGATPWGAGLAILGNAFLSTSMLMAAFAYYDDLRKRALVHKPSRANV